MTLSAGSNTEAPNSLRSQSHSSLELRHPLIIRAISPLFWGLPLLHYDHLQEISKSTKMVKDWNDYIYKVRANWKSLSIVSQYSSPFTFSSIDTPQSSSLIIKELVQFKHKSLDSVGLNDAFIICLNLTSILLCFFSIVCSRILICFNSKLEHDEETAQVSLFSFLSL